jgi:hypothetical protein
MNGRALGVPLVAWFAVSCGTPTGTDLAATDGTTSSTFLAFAPDFEGYRSWEAFPVPDGGAANGVHTAAPRVEYLNHRPPHGSVAYPVGTIIVHEVAPGAADVKTFAMVKRGGDYNRAGAAGWEWFELTRGPTATLAILWRGVGPPSGEMYGGDPSGGCNGCHGGARGDDFVQSAALDLRNF